MMNGLLCSLPGTPIVYYGDEIGMGDNIYLGDRNGVRTPMQWAPDRNAGFSRSNPQRLYLPVVADPEYQPQAVNVEAQAQNPSSLLWWMKRLIALRNRYRAFGRGTLQLLRPDNRKVIAFLRCFEDERILVIVNLSRYGQAVQLDLSEFRNAVPVELFGGTEFPTVGDLPYLFTLGPHDFYWFSLETHFPMSTEAAPAVSVPGGWEEVLEPPALTRLEEILQSYVVGQRWFRDKARRVKRVRVVEAVPVPSGRGAARLVLVEVDLDTGSPETYLLPLAFASEGWAQDLRRYHGEAIVAELRAGETPGVLYDAVWDPEFCRSLLDIMGRRRQIPGSAGRLFGVPTPEPASTAPPRG